jgi:hypothetical protein
MRGHGVLASAIHFRQPYVLDEAGGLRGAGAIVEQAPDAPGRDPTDAPFPFGSRLTY